MHVLNQHITRLAHRLNSAHDNNSTCVQRQNWRQRFSTLFSVKIAHSFLLCVTIVTVVTAVTEVTVVTMVTEVTVVTT